MVDRMLSRGSGLLVGGWPSGSSVARRLPFGRPGRGPARGAVEVEGVDDEGCGAAVEEAAVEGTAIEEAAVEEAAVEGAAVEKASVEGVDAEGVDAEG